METASERITALNVCDKAILVRPSFVCPVLANLLSCKSVYNCNHNLVLLGFFRCVNILCFNDLAKFLKEYFVKNRRFNARAASVPKGIMQNVKSYYVVHFFGTFICMVHIFALPLSYKKET